MCILQFIEASRENILGLRVTSMCGRKCWSKVPSIGKARKREQWESTCSHSVRLWMSRKIEASCRKQAACVSMGGVSLLSISCSSKKKKERAVTWMRLSSKLTARGSRAAARKSLVSWPRKLRSSCSSDLEASWRRRLWLRCAACVCPSVSACGNFGWK